MLGAELRYLDREIRRIHDLLGDTRNFVAEHKGISDTRYRPEILQRDGMLGLLDAYYRITFRPQSGDSL